MDKNKEWVLIFYRKFVNLKISVNVVNNFFLKNVLEVIYF